MKSHLTGKNYSPVVFHVGMQVCIIELGKQGTHFAPWLAAMWILISLAKGIRVALSKFIRQCNGCNRVKLAAWHGHEQLELE